MQKPVHLEGKMRTFGITPALFEKAVKPMVEDLGLTHPVVIDFTSNRTNRVAGRYRGLKKRIVVAHTGLKMERTVHVIQVCRHQTFVSSRGEFLRWSLLKTVAHELRHAWQKENGVLAKQSNTEGRYWSHPIEVDARDYSNDVAGDASRAYVAG